VVEGEAFWKNEMLKINALGVESQISMRKQEVQDYSTYFGTLS
jgi:hypothetical protein